MCLPAPFSKETNIIFSLCLVSWMTFVILLTRNILLHCPLERGKESLCNKLQFILMLMNHVINCFNISFEGTTEIAWGLSFSLSCDFTSTLCYLITSVYHHDVSTSIDHFSSCYLTLKHGLNDITFAWSRSSNYITRKCFRWYHHNCFDSSHFIFGSWRAVFNIMIYFDQVVS